MAISTHPVRAGKPRRDHSQAGQPAPKEDRRGAVASEEFLPALNELPPARRPPTGPVDQPAKTSAADHVADVVADDRRPSGDRDHEWKRERALSGERGATIRLVSPGTRAPADSAATNAKSSG